MLKMILKWLETGKKSIKINTQSFACSLVPDLNANLLSIVFACVGWILIIRDPLLCLVL